MLDVDVKNLAFEDLSKATNKHTSSKTTNPELVMRENRGKLNGILKDTILDSSKLPKTSHTTRIANERTNPLQGKSR